MQTCVCMNVCFSVLYGGDCSLIAHSRCGNKKCCGDRNAGPYQNNIKFNINMVQGGSVLSIPVRGSPTFHKN